MAIEFFLKIEGIQGDSSDKVHPGEIQLQSFSWGAAHVVAAGSQGGGGAGAGKPSLAEFSFTASTSQASPELFLAVVTGKVFPTATVTGVRTSKDPITVLELAFKDVAISSYRIGDVPDAELPVDQAALTFSQVRYTFTPLKADGSAGTPVVAGWDLKGNRTI